MAWIGVVSSGMGRVYVHVWYIGVVGYLGRCGLVLG